MSDLVKRASPEEGAVAVLDLGALKREVDDFVDNDLMMQDFTAQLQQGANLFGGLRLGGNASWAPVRDPSADWSSWGKWEVWEECSIQLVNDGQAVGPVPTGAWLVWNSADPRQMIGIPATKATARLQAEMWAVVQNGGKPTRIVPASLPPFASALEFTKVAAQIGGEMERLSGELKAG